MHCLVKINDKQALLVGGLSPDGPEANTYLFDFNTLTWHAGPELGYPRYGHACSMFKVGDVPHAIVVGGTNSKLKNVPYSLEMLDLEQGTQWTKSKLYFTFCNDRVHLHL